MKIRILRRHIKCGHRGSHSSCPVALAIKERLKNRTIDVSVGNNTFRIEFEDGKEFGATLPFSARQFILMFDGSDPIPKQPLKPFTIDLPIPRP